VLTIIHFLALGVVTVFVVTLGIGLPGSCRMASLGFCWLHLHFEVCVAFPTSCPAQSRDLPVLNMASFDGVTTICVATLGVVFHRHVRWHPEFYLCQIWRLVGASRRKTSRRSASVSIVVSRGILRLSYGNLTSFGGVATVSVGFPGSFPMLSGGLPALNLRLLKASQRLSSGLSS
jgi:hypothetical protein